MSLVQPIGVNTKVSRARAGLLGAAFAVAVAFRLSAAFGPALWRDEAQLLMVLQLGNIPTIVGFLANHESHPPLYYVLAKGWASLFGYGDRASATLALVCGLLVVVTAYRIARTLFSPRAGVVAALLVSTSSTLIFMAASVRPYAFLGLVALATTKLAWGFVQTGTWRAALAYVGGALVLIYSHNWSWLIVAAHSILAIWMGWRRHGSPFLVKWLTAYALLVLVYLPWLPALVHQARQAGHFPNTASAGRLFYECMFYLTGIRPEVAFVSAVTLGELWRLDRLSDVASKQGAAGGGSSAFFLATPAVATALAFSLRPVVNLLVRICFSSLTPVLLVGVAGLVGRERGRHRALAATIAGLLVAVSAAQSVSFYPFERTNVDEIAAYISREARGSDLVIVMPIYLASSFMRYYSGQGSVVAYPDEPVSAPVEYDHRLDRDTTSAPLTRFTSTIDLAARAHRRVWYVVGAVPGHLVVSESPQRSQSGRERTLRRVIEDRYGPPTVGDIGAGRGGYFEVVRALLYVPRGTKAMQPDTASVGPPG